MSKLSGKICLVTGASRGIGRGIALQLAVNGATCYITGRNYESLELVADEVKERGATGTIIPVQCDHSKDCEVVKLFDKIKQDQHGQLDLLVNNAFAAVELLTSCGKIPFFDLDPYNTWDTVNNVGLRNHYACSVYALRMMVPQRSGLIINIGSIGGLTYANSPAYGIGKAAKDRMARDCAVEVQKYKVAYVSLMPSCVRTQSMQIETEKAIANKETNHQVMGWLMKHGESTEFPGKCVVCLRTDPDIMKKSGKILFSTDLADEYKFKDVDGKTPVSLRSFKSMVAATGKTWLSDYLPQWLKMPCWLYKFMLSLVTVEQAKDSSKYE